MRRRESEQGGIALRGDPPPASSFRHDVCLVEDMKRAAGILPRKEKSLRGARPESFAFEGSDKMLVLLLLAPGAREINLS
jgi:hypothetical protein